MGIPKNYKKHNSETNMRGFTLIEVMVTLMILSLILLIIFGAFRLGVSAWEKGESTRQEYQKLRSVSQLVSRQVKSAVPYKMKTQKAEGDYLAFEGNGHSLRFVSALPIKSRQSEGFVYAVYEFKEGGEEGGQLILYEERALNKDFFEESLNEEEGVPLLEGISDVRFEYFRREDPDKGWTEGWVEEWNAKEEKELPQAIRLKITYKNEGKEKKGEESSLTLMASVSAYKFEDLKTGMGAAGGRFRLRPQQRSGSTTGF